MKKKWKEYFPHEERCVKKLRLMKLSVCFLLCSVMSISASVRGQYTKLTIDLKNATLEEVIWMLEKKSDITFFYNVADIADSKRVNATFKDVALDKILDEVLKEMNFSYEIQNNVVVLKKNSEQTVETPQNSVTIKGKVTDPSGTSLPGVTVMIKGTTLGVVTDVNGVFQITVPNQDVTLIFSFVGMETQNVTLKALAKGETRKELNIVMKESNTELEDFVVTGYANVKKSSFTGSSVHVSKEELLNVAPRNVIDALQVFDPSLRLMKNNAMGSDPNTLPEFYIRGQSGIGTKELDVADISQAALQNNPNTPVFIMDGFEVSVEKIYDFDPNRIASITILKDAAATAIYGSRAANGVIVIETIAPETGKVRVSYNFTGGLTLPDLSDYNLMNAEEHLEAEVLSGAFTGDENSTDLDLRSYYEEYRDKLNAVLSGVNTDWMALPLRNEFLHKHSLYIEGGSQELRFGLNLKYDNQNGVMKGSSRNRYGVALDLGYRMENLQIKNQISFDRMHAIDSPYGEFSSYVELLPYSTPYDENGELVTELPYWRNTIDENPLWEAVNTDNYSKNGYTEVTNNLSIDWYIFDDLQFKGQFAISKYDSKDEDFIDPNSRIYADLVDQLKGELTTREASRLTWNTNIYLNYLKSIKQHHLNFSLGLNSKETKTRSTYSNYQGFPSGDLHSAQFAAEITTKPTFSDNKARLFGAFASLNYTYNDIYLLDASFRVDGSSDFGTNKKFAPFWSTGVGINIHNYEFLQDSKLSLLKLRATYGQTGKVNFPAYAAKQSYNTLDDWYHTGFSTLLTYLGNENLKWERTNNYDLGFELGFLQDRFLLKGTYYNKKTIDLITDVTLPLSSGFTSYKNNMGEVRNVGVEFDLKLDIIKRKDLFVSFYANMAHNKNKILKISESLKAYNDLVNSQWSGYGSSVASTKDPAYAKPLMQYAEGGSLTSIWGMKSLGINPSDGQELFMRADGTVSSTWKASDQVIIGDSEPDAQGAFGINVAWKGFTLYASFLYEFGGDEYNQTLVNRVENVSLVDKNADKRVLTDRWKKPGDITKLRNIADQDMVTRPTSRFIQTYNGVDFNSLTLGYDFKKEWISRVGLSMLRVQFNMKDIGKICNVKQERGTTYPFARTYNFTLNASF